MITRALLWSTKNKFKMAPVAIKPREPQLGESIASQLQAGKRPKDEHSNPTATLEPPLKVAKTSNVETIEKKHHEPVLLKTYSTSTASSAASKKARETRLEQNRKAARESRRRKKVMIEDLQRSVIFFSRANGALKHQNDELTRLLMQAQNQVAIIESSTTAASSAAVGNTQQERKSENESSSESKAPVAAISASALPINTSATLYPPVPVMQPGATMQAMASFHFQTVAPKTKPK